MFPPLSLPAAIRYKGPAKTLLDWTQHPAPGIRYFSGTAAYHKTFDAPADFLKARELDLGTVHHLARVKLNGTDLGVVWTAPWRTAIPAGLLKAQANELVIEVTNVWANRLIGDEQETEDCEWTTGQWGGQHLKRFPDWFVKHQPRPSAGRIGFTTWNYFNRDSKLAPSGLLGPVRLLAQDELQKRPDLPEGAGSALSLSANVPDGFEAVLPPADALVPVIRVEEIGNPQNEGGGTDAGSIRNGTTRNGSGGAETLNDGKTYRGYGKGNSLVFRLDPAAGREISAIHSVAGHGLYDARCSQAYSVWIATADAPERFLKVTDATIAGTGGATLLRVPVNAKGVVALRLDFEDGPIGFNVYREICLVGPGASTPNP